MSKNGLILLTPTSIAYTGTSATISANGSVSFSACSVLSLNGVFSADYDNYMVVMRHLGTANVGIAFRLRSAGTDNSTASSYTYQLLYADNATVAGSRTSNDLGVIGITSSAQRSGDVSIVYGPYLTQPTAWRTVSARGWNNAAIFDYANTHNQSTSYDGFTAYPTSGNISGRVAVYGMRK